MKRAVDSITQDVVEVEKVKPSEDAVVVTKAAVPYDPASLTECNEDLCFCGCGQASDFDTDVKCAEGECCMSIRVACHTVALQQGKFQCGFGPACLCVVTKKGKKRAGATGKPELYCRYDLKTCSLCAMTMCMACKTDAWDCNCGKTREEVCDFPGVVCRKCIVECAGCKREIRKDHAVASPSGKTLCKKEACLERVNGDEEMEAFFAKERAESKKKARKGQ